MSAAAAGVLLLAGSIAAGGAPRGVATAYTTRPGDTVWEIASRELGPDADPRPLVDAILESNDVDPGTLGPGRVLVIPSGG